jgi:hypothetical protein
VEEIDANIDNTLRSIHDDVASAGEQVQQPAASCEVAALRHDAADRLGTKLPAALLDFFATCTHRSGGRIA